MTQEELAERAGLSRDAIGALERGLRRFPHPQTVRALAKGLDLPEQEVAALRAAVPKKQAIPQSAAATRPARLPVPVTRLVGRQRELADLHRLFTNEEARLVTLTGPGGVGKTRLALAAAAELEPSFAGGVAMVTFATVTDPAVVLPMMAEALGVADSTPQTLIERSAEVIRDLRFLLVLDNFEHVVKAASTVAELLVACPGLSVLATSRAPLRLRGEVEYPVPPLAIPRPTAWIGLPELAATDAVALFIERAKAANPAFVLTDQNAAAVAAICWRLGGLPLALELAAARIRFLAPADLLARLDQALQSEGASDLPARQRTLRATLDWSYDLLSAPERALLRHLAVYAGGFTLEAVEAAAPGNAERAGAVVDHLGALVEQSLVTVTLDERGTRYGMLEPIKQYALERLIEHGEEAEARLRQAQYFLALAEQANPELEGKASQVAWLDRLESEHDNIRAALAWSELAPDGTEVGIRLATALWRFWEVRGHVGEGNKWFAGLLAKSSDLPLETRAKALTAAGNLARDRGDHQLGTTYHEQSLALRRQLGDRRGVAASLNNLGVIARDQGDAARTIILCQESHALFRETGDHHGAAIALISLGMATGQLGDFDQARAYYEESLAQFRASGDSWHTAWVLVYLAHLMIAKGDLAAARLEAAEGLRLHRAANDSWGVALALSAEGRIAVAEGDLAGAAARFVESVRILTEGGINRSAPSQLESLATVALAWGQPDRAARLAGAAEAMRRAIGPSLSSGDWGGGHDLSELRIGPRAADWEAGRRAPLDTVLDEASDLAGEIARDGQ